MYEYRCDVLRVVDGDTLHLEVDLGCEIRMDMTVRLAGVNAPEMKTAEGKLTREKALGWVASWTAPPALFTVHTVKDKKEKYGRYLAVLYRDGDPKSLNTWLVDEGLAVPYMT